jgi:hypothetical protein
MYNAHPINTFLRGEPAPGGRHPLAAAARILAMLILGMALAALLVLILAAGLFMMLAV